MKKTIGSAFALVAGALAFNASAATIDFEAYPDGPTGSPILVTPNATLAGAGPTLFLLSDIYGTGQGGSVCSIASDGTCESDLSIYFTSQVTNLKFNTFGYDDGDIVHIWAFDGASLAGALTVTADQVVDFSSIGPVTRLLFDDESSGFGYAYGAFSFDVAVVPEPGTWALMLGGLAAVGAVARRKR